MQRKINTTIDTLTAERIVKICSLRFCFVFLAVTENHEMHMSPKTIDGYRKSQFEYPEIKSRVWLELYSIKNNIYWVFLPTLHNHSQGKDKY